MANLLRCSNFCSVEHPLHSWFLRRCFCQGNGEGDILSLLCGHIGVDLTLVVLYLLLLALQIELSDSANILDDAHVLGNVLNGGVLDDDTSAGTIRLKGIFV